MRSASTFLIYSTVKLPGCSALVPPFLGFIISAYQYNGYIF